ncbi:hypothetical protein [Chromohalobacter israelensis]|uniref:hypothetical protein n=1 Tax=Chromohalobacter israelensis TaxID=141390 RepID=UPI001CC39A52|nr:hypothetical protein [Chromohalobacter salexigens]MBZ5877361.1 hypothetical protein [Chromohalobacter salexigens]
MHISAYQKARLTHWAAKEKKVACGFNLVESACSWQNTLQESHSPLVKDYPWTTPAEVISVPELNEKRTKRFKLTGQPAHPFKLLSILERHADDALSAASPNRCANGAMI